MKSPGDILAWAIYGIIIYLKTFLIWLVVQETRLLLRVVWLMTFELLGELEQWPGLFSRTVARTVQCLPLSIVTY